MQRTLGKPESTMKNSTTIKPYPMSDDNKISKELQQKRRFGWRHLDMKWKCITHIILLHELPQFLPGSFLSFVQSSSIISLPLT